MAISAFAQTEEPAKNGFGEKLRESNFHLGLELQTKYIWRGMEMITQDAAPVVSADIVAAQSRITSTPTWILEGLRFPACDFKAGEVPTALELARKVRSGDTLAKDAITQIITRGLLNESLL